MQQYDYLSFQNIQVIKQFIISIFFQFIIMIPHLLMFLGLLFQHIQTIQTIVTHSLYQEAKMNVQMKTYNPNSIQITFKVNKKNILISQKQQCFEQLVIQFDSVKIILQNGNLNIEEVDERISSLQNHNSYLKSFSISHHQTDYCTFLSLFISFDNPLPLTKHKIIQQDQQIYIDFFVITINNENSQILKISNRLLLPLSIDTPYFQSSLSRNIILTICWCLLSDIAILIKFMRSIPHNYSLHIFLLTIISIISLVELIMLMIQGIPDYRIHSKQVLAYYWLGIILILIIVIQIFFGFYMRILQKKNNIYPGTIQNSIAFHKIFGYFLLTLAKAQIMFGWYLSSQYLAMILIGIYIILQLIAFLIFKNSEKTLADTRILLSSQEVKLSVLPDSSQIYSRLMQLPYNSTQLQSYNFFIHNDNVYSFTNFQFHPGGRKIIQLANHRQIDRFIYGMYHLEQYPQLNRFSHPQNVLKLLSPPIYKLQKNPLYNIRSTKFIVEEKISITESLSIFYFRQQEGQLQFIQQYNLNSIGQYFTIRGFSLTRMYTCVKSQRKEYRKIAKHLLTLLNANFQSQLQNIFEHNLTQQSFHIIDAKIQNFNEEVYEKTNLKKDPIISLVIKKYKNPEGFSYKLYEKYKTCKLQISGLHGRGLCLNSLRKGTVVLIAGGGIFPFLDLLDMIFKILASRSIKLPNHMQKQVNAYTNLLSGFKFKLFGAFVDYKQTVIPQQLVFMENFNDPLFKMYLRFVQSNHYFSKVMINERFNQQFVKKYLVDLGQQLSMVYVCGPPRMCKDILEGAAQNNIPDSKIFFV